MPTKKLKVEIRNGWVFINNKSAKFLRATDLIEIQREDSLLGDIGRVVYERDNILVKFDDAQWHQTEAEIKLWKKLDEEDKPYFGKVLGWDEKSGWIAVQKEKIHHVSILSKQNEKILQYLIDKYGLGDIFPYFANNRGVRDDGTLIIYDWGMNKYNKRRLK
jgi:hypothetical protein